MVAHRKRRDFPYLYLYPWRKRKPLTIYSESDISFCDSNPGHDGLAGVCSSILLGNSLQLQGVTITEHLVRNPEGTSEQHVRGRMSKKERARRCREEKRQTKETGTFISGPLSVEAAQRWADHCNKCWWFEFNFIVKSFNHGIKALQPPLSDRAAGEIVVIKQWGQIRAYCGVSGP